MILSRHTPPTKGRIALRSLLAITIDDFTAPEELQAIVEARA